MTPSWRRTFYGQQFTFETLQPEDKGRHAKLELRGSACPAIIQDSSTSYWLRDSLGVASDAEYLAMFFAKRNRKEAAEAMAWLVDVAGAE